MRAVIILRTAWIDDVSMSHVLAALTPTNRLIMRVALETGARIGDILALTPAILAAGEYRESKTGKMRKLELSPELTSALLAQSGEHWIFESRTNPAAHRTRQAVWKDVKRAAKAFRFRENLGCHSARKKYAVKLMEKYGNLDLVRENLNHDNIAVTMIYALADKVTSAK